jgi:hypothetical protein
MHRGSCLCGAVRFTVAGDLPQPDACHCTACRKQTGHFLASVDVLRTVLRLEGDEVLRWYRSSEKVRRGFCGICGSVLFWDAMHLNRIAVAMGAFDGRTDTTLSMHIFVAEKGDYYTIADGLPQHEH